MADGFKTLELLRKTGQAAAAAYAEPKAQAAKLAQEQFQSTFDAYKLESKQQETYQEKASLSKASQLFMQKTQEMRERNKNTMSPDELDYLDMNLYSLDSGNAKLQEEAIANIKTYKYNKMIEEQGKSLQAWDAKRIGVGVLIQKELAKDQPDQARLKALGKEQKAIETELNKTRESITATKVASQSTNWSEQDAAAWARLQTGKKPVRGDAARLFNKLVEDKDVTMSNLFVQRPAEMKKAWEDFTNWKSTITKELEAWESGGPAPTHLIPPTTPAGATPTGKRNFNNL